MKSLFDRLVNLGVGPETSSDLAVALRATNFAAMMLVLVSCGAVGMSVADARSPVLALASVVFLALYLCVLLLSGSGLSTAARLGFFIVACMHYAMVDLALGLHAGIRFAVVALVLCPALGTVQTERRLAALGYAVVGISFVVSEVITHRFGPLIVLSRAQLERSNYFNLLLLVGVVGFAVRYYQQLSRAARRQLDDANRRIAELLANVLPPPIAVRLQGKPGVIADSHGEATVLFADLVGFSALTRRLSPAHLVEVLDLVFSRFDEAAVGHRIEKIKTIGDCYMAATGVLSESEGAVAVAAVADFGLDLLRIVHDTTSEIGVPLGVRVGISTGPVVSGVIGKRKYSFDIWGDTVNLASRMQSAGVAGRVQVSEGTYWRLQHAFDFETRGVISLKGTDTASAYLLIGRKPNAAPGELTRTAADTLRIASA